MTAKPPTLSPFGIDGNIQLLDACCTSNHQSIYHMQQTTSPPLALMEIFNFWMHVVLVIINLFIIYNKQLIPI